MHPGDCLKVLFPETRLLVLRRLLVSSDKRWYLAELASALGKSSSTLQRELESLVTVGLLNREVMGRRVYFQANQRSPFFKALRDVFAIESAVKTAA